MVVKLVPEDMENCPIVDERILKHLQGKIMISSLAIPRPM